MFALLHHFHEGRRSQQRKMLKLRFLRPTSWSKWHLSKNCKGRVHCIAFWIVSIKESQRLDVYKRKTSRLNAIASLLIGIHREVAE